MFTHNESTQIETAAYQLIEKLKRYSENQKELWQQIPYLALQADTRALYNERYSLAYNKGFWAIDPNPANGYHTICVDLESGRLVNPRDTSQAPSDRDLILLTLNPEKINAKMIIIELMRKAEEPILKKGYDNPGHRSWIREWRDKLIQKNNLNPRKYSRTASAI